MSETESEVEFVSIEMPAVGERVVVLTTQPAAELGDNGEAEITTVVGRVLARNDNLLLVEGIVSKWQYLLEKLYIENIESIRPRDYRGLSRDINRYESKKMIDDFISDATRDLLELTARIDTRIDT